MSYTIYQKLKSGMANQGLADADDIDVMEDGQRVTLAEKLSGLTEDVADMAEDVSDAVAVADDIKTAQGQEVGDVAETDIAEGVLIWHGGKLYRVLSLIAAGDRWQDMDVTETTVSEEINALRGVSTEGVYLTITPASAIPAGGVKARIYNASTDTYLPEVTFTSASNRHLLGQIAYGYAYTIIMPSIDGYTQPADQTFKAGQMMRDRTVEYVDASVPNTETLVIRAKTTNNATIGAYNAAVRLYDGNGNVTSTTNLSIEGGESAPMSIPLGTRYSVTFPDISGYFTPKNQVEILTASTKNRYLNASYVYIPSSQQMWVVKDGNSIEYLTLDTDLTEYAANDTLFGLAYMDSNLVKSESIGGDCRYIYAFDLSADRSNKKWSSPAVDVPSVSFTDRNDVNNPSGWSGQSNTANVLDAIAQYEADNNATVTSIFKEINDVNTGISINGSPVKLFIPSFRQISVQSFNVNYLNTILERFGSTKRINIKRYEIPTSSQANASSGQMYNDGYTSAFSKTANTTFFAVLPLITVTESLT
jgi:hypothetical protein